MKGLHLHVDCASGAAGDMMLGALIDLGVPLDIIGNALDSIGAGRHRLVVTNVTKSGIAAIDIKVDTSGELAGAQRHQHAGHVHTGHPPHTTPAQSNAHGHAHQHEHAHAHDHAGHTHSHEHAHDHTHPPGPAAHEHEHEHDHRHPPGPADHAHEQAHGASHTHAHGPKRVHAHYHYSDIRARISGAALTEGTKRRALDIFDRIARAEAKLHGTTVEDVAFHEVGAIDSVVDVVGTAAALDWLAPASVTCTSVAMGHGTITCSHGVLPVPAPAALEVLREAGGVIADGGVARELCTPTGAAILAATVTSWQPAPVGRPLAVGWGAGDVDLADRANVLRVVVIEQPAVADTVWQIDANLDDMSPELCGPASDAVFAAGAVDVWWTPITMKKGRPALMLSALAASGVREAVIGAILRETTTIGVRYAPRERTVLARRTIEVTTRYGAIAIKVASDGGSIENAAPEYEACAAAARQHGVPLKLVYAAALAAFDGTRSVR